MVLVGRTGSGKSSTGNSILSATRFASKPSASSVTLQCQKEHSQLNGREVVIVDTPGLFDTRLSKEEITREIIKCVNMSLPGPHVFLLVLRANRFTQEETETFQNILDIFGEKLSNYAVVTFTGLDDLQKGKSSIKEYLESAPQFLKELIDRCKDRYIAFDNHASVDDKRSTIDDLLHTVDDIMNTNEDEYYTNGMYEEAEANLRKKVQEAEETKEREKCIEIAKIESRFKQRISDIQKHNQQLKTEVQCKQENQEKIQKEKENAQTELQRMIDELKKVNKTHDKELYESKLREQKKQEKIAKEIEKREAETSQKMNELKKKCAETDRKYHAMEIKKENEIERYKEKCNLETQTKLKKIMCDNNKRIDSMAAVINSKEDENNMMTSLLAKTKDELLQFQKKVHAQHLESTANYREQLEMQQQNFEKQQAQLEERQSEIQRKKEKELEDILKWMTQQNETTKTDLETQLLKHKQEAEFQQQEMEQEKARLRQENELIVQKTKQSIEEEKFQANLKLQEEMQKQSDLMAKMQRESDRKYKQHVEHISQMEAKCENLQKRFMKKEKGGGCVLS